MDMEKKELPSWFSLHRYFIWANRMRTHFDELLKNSSRGGREDGSDIEEWLYMAFWYGGLYVVIEGWQELGLHDERIDSLLQSPNVDLLRRYRNGVFHFQKKYHDDRFYEFLKSGKTAVVWVRELNRQFGRWFLEKSVSS
jgi:hypothetical protein